MLGGGVYQWSWTKRAPRFPVRPTRMRSRYKQQYHPWRWRPAILGHRMAYRASWEPQGVVSEMVVEVVRRWHFFQENTSNFLYLLLIANSLEEHRIVLERLTDVSLGFAVAMGLGSVIVLSVTIAVASVNDVLELKTLRHKLGTPLVIKRSVYLMWSTVFRWLLKWS